MNSATASAPTRLAVCDLHDLTAELGVAALVGDTQVALFRLGDGTVHAVQNLCPYAGAHVMSRGITGSRGDEPTIASPVYKQVFSLITGECLAAMDRQPVLGLSGDLAVYPVTIDNGQVFIDLAGGK